MPRSSSRPSKGKSPSTFDWSHHGKCWTVKSKEIILPRKIGGTRVHHTPRLQIRKSGIPRAGNGLHVCQEIPTAGVILTEYTGEVISIHDATNLIALVCSTPILSFRCLQTLTSPFFVQKGKATHIIHIEDSIWCFDSAISNAYPMKLYVERMCVAGFANTKPKRSDCNARFVTVGDRVFLVSTKPIGAGREVFAFYKRLEA